MLSEIVSYWPLLLAYIIGSLSSAVLISRLFGLPDPRAHGSKNPGATNVLRLSGKFWGAVVLLLDGLKACLPVLWAQQVGLDYAAWVWFAAVLGHVMPFWALTQGGKGVATYIGGLVAYCWPAALVFVISWLVCFKLTRVSALGAIGAVSITPVAAIYFWHQGPGLAWLALSTLIIVRHHSNIRRIIRGEELGFKTPTKGNEASQ